MLPLCSEAFTILPLASRPSVYVGYVAALCARTQPRRMIRGSRLRPGGCAGGRMRGGGAESSGPAWPARGSVAMQARSVTL